jgi:hypothetical protein
MKVYSYEIFKLITIPSANGLNNIVEGVNWRYQVTDDAYYADYYLVTLLSEPDSESFIQYELLTDQQVYSWIEQNEDIDQLKIIVDQKLSEKKNPSSVEKATPWDKSELYTGDEEYLMVKNNDLDNGENYFGPFKYDDKKGQRGLDWLSVTDYTFPTSIEMYQKGLLPIDSPLKINDNVNMYRVKYEDQPQLDDFYQYHEGLKWVVRDGKAVGTYDVISRTVDEVKTLLHDHLSQKSFRNQIAGVDLTVQGKTVKVNTDLVSRSTLFQRASMMISDSSEEFKLNNGEWFTLTKEEVNQVLSGINDYIRFVFLAESVISGQINSCLTIEELKQVVVEI